MNEWKCWGVTAARLARYFAMRAGLMPCAPFDDVYPEGHVVFKRLWRWERRMRIIGAERLPEPPIVFACNHIRFDDPIVLWLAIGEATGHRLFPRIMMRTGAFREGTILKSRLLDVDELATMAAAIQIDRAHPTVRQLKPFVQRLRDGQSFGIYIGRSRSRSGLAMEYREFDDPGSASFFQVQAQQRQAGLRVAAVPFTRTFNLVTKRSVFVIGDPMYIEASASREEQRMVDFSLIERIAQQVEINVPHVFALALYLHALHGLGDQVYVSTLRRRVAQILSAVTGRYVDPAARTALPEEFDRSLRFFRRQGVLDYFGNEAVLATRTILSAPPVTRRYSRINPVKFLVNQVLHLPDLVSAAEDATRGCP